MRRSEFLKLFETQKERVEKEGKGDAKWFLGFVEGLGKQKLTGYQIGALVHLLVVPDAAEVLEEKPVEIVDTAEDRETNTFSIPGII